MALKVVSLLTSSKASVSLGLRAVLSAAGPSRPSRRPAGLGPGFRTTFRSLQQRAMHGCVLLAQRRRTTAPRTGSHKVFICFRLASLKAALAYRTSLLFFFLFLCRRAKRACMGERSKGRHMAQPVGRSAGPAGPESSPVRSVRPRGREAARPPRGTGFSVSDVFLPRARPGQPRPTPSPSRVTRLPRLPRRGPGVA